MSNKMKVVAEPGKQDIVITRQFEAPRALVFKAYTDPALVAQWWGPASMAVEVATLDATLGGRWRYIHRSPDGDEYIHFGVFHEVTAPERIINTYELAGMGGVGLVTLILEERDGKTTITETSLFPSVDARDGVIQSGMEGGAAESMDRLEALLTTM